METEMEISDNFELNEKAVFCKNCPIEKYTGLRVYCNNCANRQMNKLNKFLEDFK